MSAVKSFYHEEISGYCPECGSRCGCGYGGEYAKGSRPLVHDEADGQPLSQVALPENARTPETPTGNQPREGARLSEALSTDAPSREGPAEAVSQRGYLLDLLSYALELIKTGDFSTGCCCCGSKVDWHGLGDGHSPVDEGQYYAAQMIEKIEQALASADTHRMAETGTGSGRSLSGAVPSEETADAQPVSKDHP